MGSFGAQNASHRHKSTKSKFTLEKYGLLNRLIHALYEVECLTVDVKSPILNARVVPTSVWGLNLIPNSPGTI